MTETWKNARLIAVHRLSKGISLANCLECFAAGYNRGITDVRKFVPPEEWMSLISLISYRMVDDHSVLEAGCWLAGVHRGRTDAEDQKVPLHSPDFQKHLRLSFSESWETGCIAEHALECDPSAVSLRKTIAALLASDEIPCIANQLEQTSYNAIEARRQAA